MKTPFLIIGYERSGTSMIRRLMSMHPGLDYDIIHEKAKLLWRSKTPRQAIKTLTLPAQQHGMVTGVASILSGQKIPYVGFPTAKKTINHFVSLFPATSIVHIVRDPVGAVNSQVKTFKKKGMRCVSQYFKSVPRVTKYLKSSNIRHIEIDYADVVGSPHNLLSHLYAWMGGKVTAEHINKVITTKEPWEHSGRTMCGLRYFNSVSNIKSKVVLSAACLKAIKASK